jgi:TatD DNase family protein
MQHSTSNSPSKHFPQIDIHCHRSTSNDHTRIVSLDTLALANATLDHFTYKNCTAGHVSIGVHPWHIERTDLAQAQAQLDQLASNSTVLAIGECGLDRTIATPLPLQFEAFSWQIALSERLGKPLIVHCVRAFSELLQLKKQLSPNQPWIIHGFTGKPALASQLLQHGCYLSFGKALLHHQQTQNSLSITPLERLFLETDAAIEVTIGEIYAAAAKILQLDLPTLQRQIVANFNRVFTHD